MDIIRKIAVVTGAADGIGKGIATQFGQAGARVVLGDIQKEAGADAAQAIVSAGGVAVFQYADVRVPSHAKDLVGRAVEEFGGLDVLVNNAAIQIEKTIEELEPKEWDQLMDVNLKGVYLTSKYAIPHMRARGGGSIINIASVNGFWVEPQLGAYCASKGGVITLTRSTAADFGRDGIRCNCICPGYIDTGMAARYLDSQPDPVAARAEVAYLHAAGRVGQPYDVALLAQFLASDSSSFATGSTFVLDGGLSLGVVARKEEQPW